MPQIVSDKPEATQPYNLPLDFSFELNQSGRFWTVHFGVKKNPKKEDTLVMVLRLFCQAQFKLAISIEIELS